jgi:hypothetical protein
MLAQGLRAMRSAQQEQDVEPKAYRDALTSRLYRLAVTPVDPFRRL